MSDSRISDMNSYSFTSNFKASANTHQIKQLLREAICMLCQNTVAHSSQLLIEALVGITVDNGTDVLIVNINELFDKSQNKSSADHWDDLNGSVSISSNSSGKVLSSSTSHPALAVNKNHSGDTGREEDDGNVKIKTVNDSLDSACHLNANTLKCEAVETGFASSYTDDCSLDYKDNENYEQQFTDDNEYAAQEEKDDQTMQEYPDTSYSYSAYNAATSDDVYGQQQLPVADENILARRQPQRRTCFGVNSGQIHKSRSRLYKSVRSSIKSAAIKPPDVQNTCSSNSDPGVTMTTLYTCNVCNAQMSRLYSFKRHKRIHQGIAFRCDICGTSYTRAYNLQAHRQRCLAALWNVSEQQPYSR